MLVSRVSITLNMATLNISANLVCDRSFTLYSSFMLQFSNIYSTQISMNVRSTLIAGKTIAATPSGELCPPIVFWIVKTESGMVCMNIS